MAQAETTMRRLVTLLAGDPKPTHRAALLRHLGTHNSRDNDWRECRVLEDGKPCDITEFSDLFDLYGDTALLHNKRVPPNPLIATVRCCPPTLRRCAIRANQGCTTRLWDTCVRAWAPATHSPISSNVWSKRQNETVLKIRAAPSGVTLWRT